VVLATASNEWPAAAFWMRVKATTRRRSPSKSMQSRRGHFNGRANIPGDERLLVLNGIAELIAQAKRLDLADCAFLLGIAQLGLKAKIHNISDDEMNAFFNAVRESFESH
jgi:hypothetical protein